MFFTTEPVLPADTNITGDEIEELLAFLESEDPVSSNSGSEEPNRPVHLVEERKRRRMTSNRESAKRSRLRKKNHLENLTKEANRLVLENREIKSRIAMVLNRFGSAYRENNRLRSESVNLQTRLVGLYRIFVAMQSQNVVTLNKQQL